MSQQPTSPHGIGKCGDRVGVGGRFRIDHLLNQDGMGEVHQVTDTQLGKPVALKTLHAHLAADAALRERFAAEVEARRRVADDFVVPIVDAGQDPTTGARYLVAELFKGQTLEELLEQGGPLWPEAAVRFLWQAACALEAFRQAKLVHRDIKPANLFVKTRSDGSRDLIVIDCGIVKFVDPEGRRTTFIAGTPGSDGGREQRPELAKHSVNRSECDGAPSARSALANP